MIKKAERQRIGSFWTVVLEKTLESRLGSKEIKPVNPKVNQHWISIERTDAEARILWPPDVKSRFKKTLMLERLRTEDDDRGWDGWMASTDSMAMSLSKLRKIGKTGTLQSMRLQRVGHDSATAKQKQLFYFQKWLSSYLVFFQEWFIHKHICIEYH